MQSAQQRSRTSKTIVVDAGSPMAREQLCLRVSCTDGRSAHRRAFLTNFRTYANGRLLGIVDHLSRRSATADLCGGESVHFKSATGRISCGELCTHLLQARRKRFNLLLLLRGDRLKVLLLLCQGCLQLDYYCFLLLIFAVLFEELVEEHRVH
jgi:hypothetical protein